jgi:starch synthase
MKVLFVTSEAAPFITSGGLGEVIGALPKAIQDCNKDIETEIILPLYSVIDNEFKKKMEKVKDITFNLAWRKTGASIFKCVNNDVCYYFIKNDYYCNRNDIYGEYDDGERFAFFSTAVIEFLIQSGNIPDILHANDWQTALTLIYLKTK